MPPLPRNLILVLALLLLAAIADHRAMGWSRSLSPIQHADIHAFPMQVAQWTGTDYETEITQSSRAYFGSNFIDRIYNAPGEYPIELILLPTGAGLHSPKICARFGGLSLVSEKPARPDDPSDLDRILLQSHEEKSGSGLYACSYIWRKLDGAAHEGSPFAPPTHYADSLLVSLCTPVEGSDPATRFAHLDQFRDQVQPQIEQLIGIRANKR